MSERKDNFKLPEELAELAPSHKDIDIESDIKIRSAVMKWRLKRALLAQISTVICLLMWKKNWLFEHSAPQAWLYGHIILNTLLPIKRALPSFFDIIDYDGLRFILTCFGFVTWWVSWIFLKSPSWLFFFIVYTIEMIVMYKYARFERAMKNIMKERAKQ
jgi:hypothetical protein